MRYFVTAIGTDSGKTFISAALALALEADYWKPVQAGFPTDSEKVAKLTKGKVKIHPEQYVLKTPASPHTAAEVENIEIHLSDFQLPRRENLIVESAGGCLVPLNQRDFVIDLAKLWSLEVILISNNYLGSINHTLLTLEYLKQQNIPIKGLIFNGPSNQSGEDIIMQHAGCPCIMKVPHYESCNAGTVQMLANELKSRWYELG